MRTFDAISQTALWHHDGYDPVPIRWILRRDPAGKLKPMVLGCTDEGISAEHIVLHSILRWNSEVTFQEARLHLGIETRAAMDATGDRADHSLLVRPLHAGRASRP